MTTTQQIIERVSRMSEADRLRLLNDIQDQTARPAKATIADDDMSFWNHSFWNHKSADELEAENPHLKTFDEMLGKWPGEVDDGFEEIIAEIRPSQKPRLS